MLYVSLKAGKGDKVVFGKSSGTCEDDSIFMESLGK